MTTHVRTSHRTVPASAKPGHVITIPTVEIVVSGIIFVTDAPTEERASQIAFLTVRELGLDSDDVDTLTDFEPCAGCMKAAAHDGDGYTCSVHGRYRRC